MAFVPPVVSPVKPITKIKDVLKDPEVAHKPASLAQEQSSEPTEPAVIHENPDNGVAVAETTADSGIQTENTISDVQSREPVSEIAAEKNTGEKAEKAETENVVTVSYVDMSEIETIDADSDSDNDIDEMLDFDQAQTSDDDDDDDGDSGQNVVVQEDSSISPLISASTSTPQETKEQVVDEKFKHAWTTMFELLFREIATIYYPLKEVVPPIENNIIHVKVKNEMMKDTFESRVRLALEYLRSNYDPRIDNIEVELDTSASQTSKLIYDTQDKMNDLRRENQDLPDFLKILNLSAKDM